MRSNSGTTGCGFTPTSASSCTARRKATCGRASSGTTGAEESGGGGGPRAPCAASGQLVVTLKCSTATSLNGDGSVGQTASGPHSSVTSTCLLFIGFGSLSDTSKPATTWKGSNTSAAKRASTLSPTPNPKQLTSTCPCSHRSPWKCSGLQFTTTFPSSHASSVSPTGPYCHFRAYPSQAPIASCCGSSMKYELASNSLKIVARMRLSGSPR